MGRIQISGLQPTSIVVIALSNLSGQSNKGYRACTHCLEDTDSIWLTHCRKCVYMGHRRFLPVRHQVLKKCVRNRARPEGSIASAYETEEVIDFCVDFIDDLKPIGVPESRYEGRLNGKGTLGKKISCLHR